MMPVFPIINHYFCHTLKMFNDEIVNYGGEMHEKLMSAAFFFYNKKLSNCVLLLIDTDPKL